MCRFFVAIVVVVAVKHFVVNFICVLKFGYFMLLVCAGCLDVVYEAGFWFGLVWLLLKGFLLLLLVAMVVVAAACY